MSKVKDFLMDIAYTAADAYVDEIGTTQRCASYTYGINRRTRDEVFDDMWEAVTGPIEDIDQIIEDLTEWKMERADSGKDSPLTVKAIKALTLLRSFRTGE